MALFFEPARSWERICPTEGHAIKKTLLSEDRRVLSAFRVSDQCFMIFVVCTVDPLVILSP